MDPDYLFRIILAALVIFAFVCIVGTLIALGIEFGPGF